jgi:hypothetical protein
MDFHFDLEPMFVVDSLSISVRMIAYQPRSQSGKSITTKLFDSRRSAVAYIVSVDEAPAYSWCERRDDLWVHPVLELRPVVSGQLHDILVDEIRYVPARGRRCDEASFFKYAAENNVSIRCMFSRETAVDLSVSVMTCAGI